METHSQYICILYLIEVIEIEKGKICGLGGGENEIGKYFHVFHISIYSHYYRQFSSLPACVSH